MHSLTHYFTALFVLSEKLSSLACTPKMASPSNPRKRTKRAMVKHVGQTVTTMNPTTLIGGLLETRRV